MTNPTTTSPWRGKAYVVLQFALLGLLLFLSGQQGDVSLSVQALKSILLVLALCIGGGAILQMRHFLRITPEPARGAQLLTSGIYAYLRHPMYLAVLLIGAAFCLSAPSYAWVGWGLLLVVLSEKSRFEEELLRIRFSNYAEYQARVGGIVPWGRRSR